MNKMNKSSAVISADKLAVFIRLADVLEQASQLLWDISQGDTQPIIAETKIVDELLETDAALADTMALTFNQEAQAQISESLKQAHTGKTRPAREFFNEL
jgi:hypothetical protein